MMIARAWGLLVFVAVLAACPTSNRGGSLLSGAGTTAVVERDGVSFVRLEVTVTNVDTRPVPLEWQGCRLHLELYTTATRVGTPAWRSQPVESCSTARFSQNVQPGTTYKPDPLVYERRLTQVMGDSLPDGEYFAVAVMPFMNRAALEFSAGSVSLQR